MQIRRVGAGLAVAALLINLASCGKDEKEAAKFERADNDDFSRDMSDISSFTLDNGIVVYLQEEHTNDQVALEFLYRAGFMDEPRGRAQLSHIAEHLLVYSAAGAYKAEESYKAVQDSKGLLSAEAVSDFSHIDYVVNSDSLEQALRIEQGRMTGIRCDDTIRKREAEQAISEIDQVMGSAKGSLVKYGMMALNQALYYGSRYVPIVENARAITCAQAEQFVHDNVRPDDAVVVIIGNIDKARAEAAVRKYLGTIPARPRPAEVRKPVAGNVDAGWDIKDGKALYFVAAGPYDSYRDRLVLTMFGSYLHQVLMTSEEVYGPCRSVYASNQVYRVGDIPFFAFAEPGEGRTIDEMRPILQKYLQAAITSLNDDRVEAIKASIVSFETSTGLKKDKPDYPLMHHQVIGQEALNVGMRHALREGRSMDEFVTEANSITPDEFRAVVSKYIDPAHMQQISFSYRK